MEFMEHSNVPMLVSAKKIKCTFSAQVVSLLFYLTDALKLATTTVISCAPFLNLNLETDQSKSVSSTMKKLLMLLLVARDLFVHCQDTAVISKLIKFIDENPKLYVNSTDCELMIYEKTNSKRRQEPSNKVETRLFGQLPTKGTKQYDLRGDKVIFFRHAGAQFNIRDTLYYNLKLNADHK